MLASILRSPPPCLIVLLGLLAPGCGDDSGTFPGPTAKLLVFSDPHYFAPALGPSGTAFASYLAQDRKLIAESDAIMRAMVDLVDAENPQLVLIPGDLTKDGERASHDAVAGFLRQMEKGGRRVFVVPGNHDIQNGSANRYAADTATPVPAISAADFAGIYEDAGFGEAIARDASSLSYVAELVPGLWLLAIDSCIYGAERGSSQTAGSVSGATRAWIASTLTEAKRRGVRVLAMMHHGLVEHFTNQTLLFADFVVQDRAAVAQLLAEGRVRTVFTGHFHANDITQAVPAGHPLPIFDVETGSTVTYPCPYRIVDLESDTLAITTKHVTTIDAHLHGSRDLQTFARDDLRLGLEGLIARLVQSPPYSISSERAAKVAPWLAEGLVAHSVGDEIMPAEVSPELLDLLSSGSMVEQLAAAMLQSIWTDLPTADNTATLDISSGN